MSTTGKQTRKSGTKTQKEQQKTPWKMLGVFANP